VELPLRRAVPIPSSISIRFFANFIQPLFVKTRLFAQAPRVHYGKSFTGPKEWEAPKAAIS